MGGAGKSTASWRGFVLTFPEIRISNNLVWLPARWVSTHSLEKKQANEKEHSKGYVLWKSVQF